MTAVLTPAQMSATAASAVPSAPPVPAGTRFRRRALGISIIAGAVLTVAGSAATRWEESSKTIDLLDSLAANPNQTQIAAGLLHFGYMGFGAVLLLLAAMTRGSRSKLVTLALGAGAVGALTLPGLLVLDMYDLAIRTTLPAGQAVETSEQAGGYWMSVVLAAPTVFLVLIGVTTGLVAAWKRGFLHWSIAPIFVIGFLSPMFLEGAGVVANTAGPAVAFAALAAVGVRALRMTDAQYYTGSVTGTV